MEHRTTRCVTGLQAFAVGLALLPVGCEPSPVPDNPDALRAELVPDPMDPSQLVQPGYMPAMPSVEDRMRLLIQPGSDVSQDMAGFPIDSPDSASAASNAPADP